MILKHEHMNEFPLMNEKEGIALFYPDIPENAANFIAEVLQTRWIGQGPRVDEFERKFGTIFEAEGRCVAVNSGTAAIHLSYIMAGVKEHSEVICPVFTCTATNLPILYQNAEPVFCDISSTSLNVDIDKIENLITEKTVAISVVDYGGKPNDYPKLRTICDRYGLKLIADCAHSLGTKLNGKSIYEYADFTIHSFQAIKTMTTGDGGMLVLRDKELIQKAKRLRWFGINREAKQNGVWENDITEIGYKYQMTDISAAIGLAALENIEGSLEKRKSLYQEYIRHLGRLSEFLLERPNACEDFSPWLVTINCQGHRIPLMNYLRSKKIETAQVHYRNDRYSIFSGSRASFPNMDRIEKDYLVLPLHSRMDTHDVALIAKNIAEYFAYSQDINSQSGKMS